MKKIVAIILIFFITSCTPYVKTTDSVVLNKEVLKVVHVDTESGTTCVYVNCDSWTDYKITFNNQDTYTTNRTTVIGDMYYKLTIRNTTFNYSDYSEGYKDVIKFEEIKD